MLPRKSNAKPGRLHTHVVRDTGILAVDSVARRINRESFLLLGGTAALLMQVAHPLLAAGVDQHSHFCPSPPRRLVCPGGTTPAGVFRGRGAARGAPERVRPPHPPRRRPA